MSAMVSRRGLVTGGLAAGAALTLAAAGAAGASAWAEEASGDEQWDAEYDVVVLGMGGTGLNAAIAAYESGAKTLIVEKAPEGSTPCNTVASGQCVMATDDADGLYTYLSALMGQFGNWDEDVLRAYCEGCLENWDWMVDTLGMDPDIACPTDIENVKWTHNPNVTYPLVENAWGLGRAGYVYNWHEFPEFEGNEHSLIILVNAVNGDRGYYNLLHKALYERVDDDRLTAWVASPGKRLVLDADGQVVGAVIEHEGAEVRVKANGGVVLATGGFEANQDMVSDFTQQPYVYLRAGTLNTGDGVLMAEAAGARLWHMSNVAGWNWGYKSPELSTCAWVTNGSIKGILAGSNGARFMNENAAANHGRINIGGRWISTPMPLPTYLIVDSTLIGDKLVSTFSEGNADEIESGEVISADTIEELSEKIRAIGDAPKFNLSGELDEALERYNAHCHANDGQGEKDDFGRECTQPLEQGPFYAVKLGPWMFNTQGGPRRNQYAQVIGTDDMPIEGLFVGGELGSTFADMYNGGGNLGETMVFGRMAGRNAAARAQGTFAGATEPVKTHNQREAEAAADSQPQESTIDLSSLADGVYEGKGRGFGGTIELQVTVEGGKIADVQVLSDSETPTIGELALPDYCEAATQVDSLDDIDVSTGASNTLRGFKAAIVDALSQ